MKKDNKTSEEIVTGALEELKAAVEKFAETISLNTINPSAFLTMEQLEDMMAALDKETRKIYLDMISTYLSNIDEREIIASKKENTKKGE